MPQSDPIDFWFSIGSLYTFLTVMRMDRVEDTTDVRFVWRPFRIRTIMEEMNNLPGTQPRKLAYAFRDVHRRAALYGFAFEGQPPYPLANSDLANRVAVVGARIMSVRPTGAGSSRARRQAPNRICRTRCARSAKTHAACSRSRPPTRPPAPWMSRPTKRVGSEFSAPRHSLRAENCSGATTGWMTP